MRPAPFVYSRPSTLRAALDAMAAGAVPLAGGQSLLQAMRLRASEPAALVDISAIGELSRNCEWTRTTLTLGALMTHSDLIAAHEVRAEMPWLCAAARQLGDVQVRNLGTVLGNVCWADPRANMLVALLASDAVIVARHTTGERRIPSEGFATGFRRHALEGALAVAIEVPRLPAHGVYLEFSRQRQDLALVNVCVVRATGHARIAIGGVHQTPVRARAAEALLATRPLQTTLTAGELAALFEQLALDPVTDPYGAPDYKRELARVLVGRALRTIAENAR